MTPIEELIEFIEIHGNGTSDRNKVLTVNDIYEYAQALQLLQTDVMPCFSEEQIERINKYARHQYNRGQLDLTLVSFEEWVNKV